MIAMAPDEVEVQSLADLLERLGSIPTSRIAASPPPGTATEKDILTRANGRKRLYELVDGVLVEKAMGYFESRMAAVLVYFIEAFLGQHELGIVFGPDATVRLISGLLRLPDVSYYSWDHFPGRELPAEPVLNAAPDLAVEVLSESNTGPEMERKLHEYFDAGVRLVWYTDPVAKTVRVYNSPESFKVLTLDDTLDGGDVLPGFRLPIREWFERTGRRKSR